MKTITIVAIIAAVAIVGAACIGIPLSGVLNGGTTGPGGDDPVVPTEPVEPTPTETPTETPTATPTDSSMSYFSPMTSSGSSNSGGSSSPVCEHGAWIYSDLGEGKHTITCGKCSSYSVEDDCAYGNTYVPAEDDSHTSVCICGATKTGDCVGSGEYRIGETADTQQQTHQEICKLCGNLMDSAQACAAATEEAEKKYSTDTVSMKHQDICVTCGNPFGDATSCTLGAYVPISGESNHHMTCTVCGYDEYIGVCSNDAEGEDKITPDNSALTHSGKCSLCQNPLSHADCTIIQKPTGEAGKHINTCASCGRQNDASGTAYEAVDCSEFTCVSGSTASKHKEVCTACGQEKANSETDCTYEGTVTSNNDGTHNVECTVCKIPKKFDCTYEGAVTSNNDGTHNVKCTVCTNSKAVVCTYGTPNYDKDGSHISTCTVTDCGYEKREECTLKYDMNQDGTLTHKKTCEKCSEEFDLKELCVFEQSDNEANTEVCDCGRKKITVSTADELKSAITNAQDGDVIYVKEGTYENVGEIDVTKVLFITGAGKDVAVLNDAVFDIESSAADHKMYVTFDGLKFLGKSQIKVGFNDKQNSVYEELVLTTLTVRNCYANTAIDTDKGSFIWLNSTYNTMLDLTVYGNTLINSHSIAGEDASPVIWGGGTLINKVEITGNTFGSTDNPCDRYAVKFGRRTVGTEITITGNTIYGATTAEKDFYLLNLYQSGSNAYNDLTVTVNGNTILCTPDEGRSVYHAYIEDTVKGSNIKVTSDGTVLDMSVNTSPAE